MNGTRRWALVSWASLVVIGGAGTWACSGGDDNIASAQDGGADGTSSGDDASGGGGDDGSGGGGDDAGGGGGDAGNKNDGNPDNACGAMSTKNACVACCAGDHDGGVRTLLTAEADCACSDNQHCLGAQKCGQQKATCLAQAGEADAAAACTACFQETLKADAGNSCIPQITAACSANPACIAFEQCSATQCQGKP